MRNLTSGSRRTVGDDFAPAGSCAAPLWNLLALHRRRAWIRRMVRKTFQLKRAAQVDNRSRRRRGAVHRQRSFDRLQEQHATFRQELQLDDERAVRIV
jgi:hypothetical protein